MGIYLTSGCPRKPLITLKKHQIEHEFKLVPEIGHDTMALLKGLGETNWDLYKSSLLKEKK
jgi:hypothetical protein